MLTTNTTLKMLALYSIPVFFIFKVNIKIVFSLLFCVVYIIYDTKPIV